MGRTSNREAVVPATAALFFAAAALRSVTPGFLGGAPSASPSTAGLRGSLLDRSAVFSAASPVKASVVDMGTLAVSSIAAIAVAAGCARVFSSRRRSQSSVALSATRAEWYRKVQRIGQDRAMFEVTVQKPMGVKMERLPDPKNPGEFKGIGISQIVDDSNTDTLNRKVCMEEIEGMWVLEGDRVLAINGESVEFGDIDDAVRLVSTSTGDEITLTLLRNTRKGPIKVIMMPEGRSAIVRRNSRLSAAAEYAAGKELKYGCIDGWCGTCWHRERSTDGIFKPCSDVLTGDWDNVMPLVLTAKPEKAGDSTFLKPRGV